MRHWFAAQQKPEQGGSATVMALSALYQAERQDSARIMSTVLALIVGALTYLGIAALLLNDVRLPGGAWAAAFLAFPLWVAAAFHVLLVGNALVRSGSIEVIERRLVDFAGLYADRGRLGSRAEQQVMNVDEQPTVLKIQTFICYVGVGIVIISFSVACITVAAKKAGWVSAPVFSAGAAYLLLLAAAMAAWIHVLEFAKEITPKD